ncbi:serine carboxypeptidase [Daedaleopsis nitida]|nr:serine carboxypeptidase [Daedaleopsis nitida]
MRFFWPLLALVAIVRGAQYPFAQPASSAPYDDGLFTPLEDLHALSASEHTTLRHPNFPAYGVRIKKSHFCDGETQYDARHLFFYFFESRNDPDTDDVVFWTNGGPGGSSSMGLFMELGPCRVTGPNSTERFEYAWNDRANVFFIDQPIGVGFSYADHGEKVGSTIEAGQDIAAFVTIFFEHFSKFKGRPFHMAGESYGGRYIPVYASAVYDANGQLVEAGMTPINISSIIIGNGCTDFIGMLTSYYEIRCEDYGFPPITSISDCVRLKQLVPRCKKKMQESCKDILDHIDCGSSFEFCATSFMSLFDEYNPYDALRPCKGKPDLDDCYPDTKDIHEYLNNPTTQSILGIDPLHNNFTAIDLDLNTRFFHDLWDFRAEHYLAALLEHGVRVLIYVGDTDWICNWVGNQRMTLELEWSSQEAFRNEPLREWSVDGKVAGKTRRSGKLSFATIRDAGHLAPYDQPVRSLELVNRWLADKDL